MNSFYGVLGTPACRFFEPRLASSITLRGHEIITKSRAFIESEGYRVIYGDTDSLFVLLDEGKAEKRCLALGSELAKRLNTFWSKKLQEEQYFRSKRPAGRRAGSLVRHAAAGPGRSSGSATDCARASESSAFAPFSVGSSWPRIQTPSLVVAKPFATSSRIVRAARLNRLPRKPKPTRLIMNVGHVAGRARTTLEPMKARHRNEARIREDALAIVQQKESQEVTKLAGSRTYPVEPDGLAEWVRAARDAGYVREIFLPRRTHDRHGADGGKIATRAHEANSASIRSDAIHDVIYPKIVGAWSKTLARFAENELFERRIACPQYPRGSEAGSAHRCRRTQASERCDQGRAPRAVRSRGAERGCPDGR